MTFAPISVTIEVPQEVVQEVVTTHQRYLDGQIDDEWAAYHVIGEWMGQGDTLDIEHHVADTILDAYNLPQSREEVTPA